MSLEYDPREKRAQLVRLGASLQVGRAEFLGLRQLKLIECVICRSVDYYRLTELGRAAAKGKA